MHNRSAPFALNLYSHPELGYYEGGRDLFTFVTVASSHIMRTLQRPKKSRPTKRKVNHRRFLQNQICRSVLILLQYLFFLLTVPVNLVVLLTNRHYIFQHLCQFLIFLSTNVTLTCSVQ